MNTLLNQLKKGKAGGIDEMLPEFVKKGGKVMRKEIKKAYKVVLG